MLKSSKFSMVIAIFLATFTLSLAQLAQAAPIKEIKPVATDSMVTSMVIQKIAQDPVLKNYSITVATKHHVVELSGEVDTGKQAEKLVALASSIEEVRDVNTSHLSVKNSRAPLTDTYITAKILGKLVKDKLFSNYEVAISKINIETKNATVFITGTVGSQREKNHIEAIAKQTDGVKKVVADLKVNTHD